MATLTGQLLLFEHRAARIVPGYVRIEGLQISNTRGPAAEAGGLIYKHDGTTGSFWAQDNIVRKISSGTVKFDTLVIERNMDGSPNDQIFQDWFNEMFQLNGASGGSSVRRNGAVVKLENGNEVMRFAFFEGWVKKSSFSDLEAASANLFKQIVEIEHNGLERIPA